MIPGVVAGYPYDAAPPASVTFQSASAQYALGTSINIGKPSTVNDGDLLVFCVFNANQLRTVTPPSGLSLLFSDTSGANGVRIYTKVASSEPSNYTFTLNSTDRIGICICAYANASTISTIGNLDRAITTTQPCPSITPSASGALLAISGHENAGTPIVPTQPSGMSLRANADGANAHIAVSDLIPSPAGSPSGNKTYTWPATTSPFGILVQVS